jgi:hypothetical protein
MVGESAMHHAVLSNSAPNVKAIEQEVTEEEGERTLLGRELL